MAFSILDGPVSPRTLATLEDVQLCKERLFALEKQMQMQLVIQGEKQDHLDLRLRALESRQNVNGVSATSNDGHGGQSLDTVGEAAVLLLQERVRKLEENLKHSNTNGSDLPLPAEPNLMLVVRELEARQNQHHTNFENLKRQTLDLSDRMSEYFTKYSDRVTAMELEADGIRSIMPEAAAKEHVRGLREDPEYRLARSVWDLLLFIGTKEREKMGSLFTLILATLNIALQVAFVMVCNYNFLESDIDSEAVKAAKAFRIRVGSDSRYMNTLTQASLARRLCSEHHLELEIATAQASLLEVAQKYLRSDAGWMQWTFSGRTMCVLALIVWTMAVIKDFHSILNFANAVSVLPRCSFQEWTKINAKTNMDRMFLGGGLFFEQINIWRYVFILVSIMVRAGIAGNLFVCGSLWLARTVDVEGLLLNAVALEFVLATDEIIFEALASDHSRALIQNFMPLPSDSKFYRHHHELRSGIFLLVIPVSVIFFYMLTTEPLVADMTAVRCALCEQYC